MPSSAAEAPRSPSLRGSYGRRTCRRWREASPARVVIVLALLLFLLASPLAEAGSFPVVQEQVRTGTTNGIAGVEAEDGLREILAEAGVASNLSSQPTAQNVTAGSPVAGSFPADAAVADGVYLQYRGMTPGPATGISNPATTAVGCTWTACESGRLSDNVTASSAAGGDVATYGSFSLGVPASSVITQVYLGYEAFDPGGNDHLSIEISWDGGTTVCPAFVTGALPATDPDAYTFVNVTVCAGHTWLPADFGTSLAMRFTHVVLGGADTIDLDASVVRVTYQPLSYQLRVLYDWSGIPSGQAYTLALTGHVSNASVSVQVLTPPSSWTARLAISGTTDEALSYSLAPAEVTFGNVSIRFDYTLGSSPAPSDLWIDLAQLVRVQYAYRLDVVQNGTGITGDRPILTVEGNISAGGENFDVFLWDFSRNAWGLALLAPFTATNAVHTVPVISREISNSSVRINFRDRDPTNVVPATLSLDLVRVDTTDVASAPPWPLVLWGVAAAVFLLAMCLVVFVLPRWKRSAPEESEEGPLEVTSSADAQAKTSAVPTVDVEALEPGHAYLVTEDVPDAGLRVLEELTRMGRSGLVVTRRTASGVESLVRPRHTTVAVLGDEPGAVAGTVTDANQEPVLSLIVAFLRTNPVGVVLLDGIGGLAGPGGFPALLDVVQRTSAKVSLGQQILLASAPSGSLNESEEKRLRGHLQFVCVSAPRVGPVASMRE